MCAIQRHEHSQPVLESGTERLEDQSEEGCFFSLYFLVRAMSWVPVLERQRRPHLSC